MFFSRRAGNKYIDRGDITDYDFIVSGLTTDWQWHELDLSAIIPLNAIAVHILGIVRDDSAISNFQLRKKGYSNEINISRITTQNNLASMNLDVIQPCSVDRVIEYRATNTTFTTISIYVRGWLK